MRILLAPDKFKACLTADEVARAMEEGVRRARPDAVVDRCPLADGGEGTAQALISARGGQWYTRKVTGPLPEMKVDAKFAMLPDKTAVIDMSSASGIALLPLEDRNPMNTTTFGTGELMMTAVRLGARRIIIGLGGSATVDGGIGAAQACGLPVILQNGEPISPTEPLVGADLPRVVLIKHGRGSAIERVPIVVACDVTNPLCGPTGAATVFGPQKGASAEDVKTLDGWLAQLAVRNEKEKLAEIPGAGAAGGLGFALAAFFGATLERGIEMIMDTVGFSKRLQGVDLCLTGEGHVDRSTLDGKAAIGVVNRCRAANVPCIILGGAVAEGTGLNAVAIGDGSAEAFANARELLARAAERILRDHLHL